MKPAACNSILITKAFIDAVLPSSDLGLGQEISVLPDVGFGFVPPISWIGGQSLSHHLGNFTNIHKVHSYAPRIALLYSMKDAYDGLLDVLEFCLIVFIGIVDACDNSMFGHAKLWIKGCRYHLHIAIERSVPFDPILLFAQTNINVKHLGIEHVRITNEFAPLSHYWCLVILL